MMCQRPRSPSPLQSEGSISVVIPTHNRPGALRRCLDSLARQDDGDPFEVVVVDDGSEPPVELPTGPLPRLALVLIRQPNRGAAAARAAGIARASGGILAFVDDDCTVAPDYLAQIQRAFRAHADTRVVQVGLQIGAPVGLYGRVWKFSLEETLKVNLASTADHRQVCGILGGVMVARRDVFDEVGFDVGLHLSREDADLRYQLDARGVPVYYEPSIRVFHHCRRTLRGYLAQIFGYGRGEFHFRRKWATTTSSPRYVKLTSPRAFRALVDSEGVGGALLIFGVLMLRQHAALWGTLYEAVAYEGAGGGTRQRMRFVSALVRAYGRRCARLFRCVGVSARA